MGSLVDSPLEIDRNTPQAARSQWSRSPYLNADGIPT
jgi:hypothetical protein